MLNGPEVIFGRYRISSNVFKKFSRGVVGPSIFLKSCHTRFVVWNISVIGEMLLVVQNLVLYKTLFYLIPNLECYLGCKLRALSKVICLSNGKIFWIVIWARNIPFKIVF